VDVWAYCSNIEEIGRVQVRLSKAEQGQLDELLRGGLQPVRTVLRALVLRQLADGQTDPLGGAQCGAAASCWRSAGSSPAEHCTEKKMGCAGSKQRGFGRHESWATRNAGAIRDSGVRNSATENHGVSPLAQIFTIRRQFLDTTAALIVENAFHSG
jgi:hypothetical protein